MRNTVFGGFMILFLVLAAKLRFVEALQQVVDASSCIRPHITPFLNLTGKNEYDFEMPHLCGILMVRRICGNLIQIDLSKSKVFVQVCK